MKRPETYIGLPDEYELKLDQDESLSSIADNLDRIVEQLKRLNETMEGIRWK